MKKLTTITTNILYSSSTKSNKRSSASTNIKSSIIQLLNISDQMNCIYMSIVYDITTKSNIFYISKKALDIDNIIYEKKEKIRKLKPNVKTREILLKSPFKELFNIYSYDKILWSIYEYDKDNNIAILTFN